MLIPQIKGRGTGFLSDWKFRSSHFTPASFPLKLILKVCARPPSQSLSDRRSSRSKADFLPGLARYEHKCLHLAWGWSGFLPLRAFLTSPLFFPRQRWDHRRILPWRGSTPSCLQAFRQRKSLPVRREKGLDLLSREESTERCELRRSRRHFRLRNSNAVRACGGNNLIFLSGSLRP